MITVHADSPEDVVYRLAIPLANTGQQEVSRKLVEAVLPKPTMRADRVSVAPSGEGALAEAEILVVDDDSAGWTGGYANSGKQDENTLNSIASLSRSEPDRMASLLNEFGQYLRESFRFESSEPLIPFERELALVRSYLHIEKVRFEDWLSYQIEISTTTDFLIPPLTLQTLVENAIRHGIMQQAEGGHVLIRVYRTDEHVCVAVEDDGVGIAADVLEHLFTDSLSGGIGLKNIERRLRQLFGQGLRINSAQGTGTEILIRLPLEKVGISYESNHRG
ncbi:MULTISPECIES: sensor histidine kinase [Brevibacillus]|uniref:sensor histidine kinase n=1 Tax=Brevibacillus TaxID=55080 RepID=UPI00156A77C2|nr:MULTISPECIES: ATP-binding protein [Brevibacillus]MDH6349017.1 signal transduction histidine kinase [Brevibacillus sp. 1238]MED2257708.1 ATP-binding protein [Brevibacillus parabrevis]UED71260.1 histidine kinase [Brevibacillus sp. HD3.3A]WDV97486.1 ATP-binding protein [Brevibacillus parabrevis]